MNRVSLSALIGIATINIVADGLADPGQYDSIAAPASPAVVDVTAVPAENNIKGRVVYFTPMDENTSATVLFVYNTNDKSNVFNLTTFRLDGTIHITQNISVPPHGMVRICSDTVDTIAASWQDVLLLNFTTQSAYGALTLPKKFHATGYIVWNGDSVYDPLDTAAPIFNLTFTSEKPRRPVP